MEDSKTPLKLVWIFWFKLLWLLPISYYTQMPIFLIIDSPGVCQMLLSVFMKIYENEFIYCSQHLYRIGIIFIPVLQITEAQRINVTCSKLQVEGDWVGLWTQFGSRVCALNCLDFSDFTGHGESNNCLKLIAELTSVWG